MPWAVSQQQPVLTGTPSLPLEPVQAAVKLGLQELRHTAWKQDPIHRVLGAAPLFRDSTTGDDLQFP